MLVESPYKNGGTLTIPVADFFLGGGGGGSTKGSCPSLIELKQLWRPIFGNCATFFEE